MSLQLFSVGRSSEHKTANTNDADEIDDEIGECPQKQ